MPLRFIAGRILRELIGLLTLSMMALPGVAVAQDVAASLDELLRSGSLQPGEGVYVTDAAGRRLKGTLSEVSSTGLVVTQREQAWTVADADVREIELQDSLRNGIAYGMVAVAGPIAAVCGAGGSHPGEMRLRVVVRVSGRGDRRRRRRCRGRSPAQDGLPRGRVGASIRVTDRVAPESRRTDIGRLVNPPGLTRFAAVISQQKSRESSSPCGLCWGRRASRGAACRLRR